MPSAAALIVQDGSVALIERRRAGNLYYLFPGGQIDPGETPEQAAVREIEEELGLTVEIGPLAALVTFGDSEQSYFQAAVTGGRFGTGEGAEMQGLAAPEAGVYAAVWLPLADLASVDVRPRAVANLVARTVADGWPSEVLSISEG